MLERPTVAFQAFNDDLFELVRGALAVGHILRPDDGQAVVGGFNCCLADSLPGQELDEFFPLLFKGI